MYMNLQAIGTNIIVEEFPEDKTNAIISSEENSIIKATVLSFGEKVNTSTYISINGIQFAPPISNGDIVWFNKTLATKIPIPDKKIYCVDYDNVLAREF